MILVTVGTTMPFDDLIKKVDQLAELNFFGTPVLCQIGKGIYIPVNCQYFRHKPRLEEEFDKMQGLIVHGGTGSTIQAICSGKPFVAVANPMASQDHQAEFLENLSKEIDLVWTKAPAQIPVLWEEAIRISKNRQWRGSKNLEKLTSKILEISS